jgi:hypothetical protein
MEGSKSEQLSLTLWLLVVSCWLAGKTYCCKGEKIWPLSNGSALKQVVIARRHDVAIFHCSINVRPVNKGMDGLL